MHDPRTSTALRTLARLTGDPPPRRWSWTIGRLDRAGRLCLGRVVADALGPGPPGLRWHHLALLVEPDWDLGGRVTSLDERGRVLAPAWLRERGRDVLVGLDLDGPTVLVGDDLAHREGRCSRERPVSPSLLAELQRHDTGRAHQDGPSFRRRDGRR